MRLSGGVSGVGGLTRLTRSERLGLKHTSAVYLNISGGGSRVSPECVRIFRISPGSVMSFLNPPMSSSCLHGNATTVISNNKTTNRRASPSASEKDLKQNHWHIRKMLSFRLQPDEVETAPRRLHSQETRFRSGSVFVTSAGAP